MPNNSNDFRTMINNINALSGYASGIESKLNKSNEYFWSGVILNAKSFDEDETKKCALELKGIIEELTKITKYCSEKLNELPDLKNNASSNDDDMHLYVPNDSNNMSSDTSKNDKNVADSKNTSNATGSISGNGSKKNLGSLTDNRMNTRD